MKLTTRKKFNKIKYHLKELLKVTIIVAYKALILGIVLLLLGII